MTTPVMKTDELAALRQIGDPVLEHTILDHVFAATQERGFLAFAAALPPEAVPPGPPTIPIDKEKVKAAVSLFARYGTEIAGALLLAALPQAYAARWGSQVLAATARLQKDFRRRIVRTAQFVLLVTQPAQDDESVDYLWTQNAAVVTPDRPLEETPPWIGCLAVRLFNEAVRRHIQGDEALQKSVGEENATPLNQEDLLATQLSFTVTVFEVLERYGIAWGADEQEACMYLWDLVGERLGIGTTAVRDRMPADLKARLHNERWIGLRPPTIEATRQLFDQLRRRQWLQPAAIAPNIGKAEDGHPDCTAGRVLLRALLNELAAAMPNGTRGIPLAVIRQLAEPVVRDRLSLGGGGIVMSMLDLLPKRRLMPDPFTVVPAANRAGGAALRSMADEVTRRAVLRFVERRTCSFPGSTSGPGGCVIRWRSASRERGQERGDWRSTRRLHAPVHRHRGQHTALGDARRADGGRRSGPQRAHQLPCHRGGRGRRPLHGGRRLRPLRGGRRRRGRRGGHPARLPGQAVGRRR
jgi:ER-bound oxygenase mpaB/B'/Rubber oxygenase, catalytic domain